MLEGLDRIPWATLQGPYGYVGDIPLHIQALLSSDHDVRQKGAYDLHDSIMHQGIIDEASIYVVPYLLELLSIERIEDKGEILYILFDIALATSTKSYSGENLKSNPINYPPEYIAFIESVRPMIIREYPVLVKLLLNPDPFVSHEAASLLATFYEEKEEIEKIFLDFVLHTPTVSAKASVIYALSDLWKWFGDARRKQAIEYFRAIVETPSSPLAIRFVGALALAEWLPQEDFAEIFPVIEESINADDEMFDATIYEDKKRLLINIYRSSWRFPRIQVQWSLKWLQSSQPRVRESALQKLQWLSYEWRWIPDQILDDVLRLLDDSDAAVRLIALRMVYEFAILSEVAKKRLKLCIRRGVTSTERDKAKKFWEELPYIEFYLTEPPPPHQPFDKAILDLPPETVLERLEAEAEADAPVMVEIYKLLNTLWKYIDVVNGPRTVSILQQVLSRINGSANMSSKFLATIALWRIDPQQAPLVASSLAEIISVHPGNAPALNLLGEVGSAGKVAIPILKHLIESEARILQTQGYLHSRIAPDEKLRRRAQRIINQIEAATE